MKAKKKENPSQKETDKKTSAPFKSRKLKRKTKKQNARNKTLVIVESPAKARTLTKYLGSKYIIEASMGHIIDLPKSRMAVDVKNNFEPEYITVRGRAPILNRLKKLASSSSKVLLAADPDREGEAISWHLARALKKSNTDIKRIEFNEITKAAVIEAVSQPREIDSDRVNAQQARRILDRLVGYSISPLLWKKIKRGLSAGRVQSIANMLICNREKEIDDFVPREYWTLNLKLQNNKKKIINAELHSINGNKAEINNKTEIDKIISDIEKESFIIKSIIRRERKRQPTAPYITSRLQQDASTKLGFTSFKTMIVAQQLYEGIDTKKSGGITGLITYMRTDSNRTSPVALEKVRDYIKNRDDLGATFLYEEIRIYKNNKNAQDAHEAIRPTEPSRHPDDIKQYLTTEQFRLYRLIWQKFVSSQMSEEISDHTTIDIIAGKYLFRAKGRIVKFPGFTVIANADDKKKSEEILPELEENETLKHKKTIPEQHFTQPPPRYSDASMVRTLEESGVGRPSTYAPTIQTLLKRFYAVRVQKALKPTELGILVNSVVTQHFPDLTNVDFTARMELDLDRIANSDLDWVEMLKKFYSDFEVTVRDASVNIEEMRNILDVETDYICEKCGRKLVKKIGRNGYFLACPGFPECRNARSIPLGRCPVCETGDVVKRATKRGRSFYGCSSYPDCEFSTWDKPVPDTYCPKCEKILLEKSSREKGKHIACSTCDYESSAQSA